MLPPTPFLISPIDRPKFVGSYVVASLVLWVLLGTLFSVPPLNWIPNTTAQVAVHALITGLGVGTGQWWILRSYIPNWGWIGATAVGASLAALTQNLWYNKVLLQQLEQPETEGLLDIFSGSPLGILLSLQGVTILAFCFWLAGAQWLVLRQYVRSASWWWITPLISLLLTWLILLIALVLYAVVGGQFLSDRVLFPGMLAAVQSLTLCRFHLRSNQDEAVREEDQSIEPELDMHLSRTGLPFVGLSIATLFSVVILSISIQGFLTWFGV